MALLHVEQRSQVVTNNLEIFRWDERTAGGRVGRNLLFSTAPPAAAPQSRRGSYVMKMSAVPSLSLPPRSPLSNSLGPSSPLCLGWRRAPSQLSRGEGGRRTPYEKEEEDDIDEKKMDRRAPPSCGRRVRGLLRGGYAQIQHVLLKGQLHRKGCSMLGQDRRHES